jgi:hypothetical protein
VDTCFNASAAVLFVRVVKLTYFFPKSAALANPV